MSGCRCIYRVIEKSRTSPILCIVDRCAVCFDVTALDGRLFATETSPCTNKAGLLVGWQGSRKSLEHIVLFGVAGAAVTCTWAKLSPMAVAGLVRNNFEQ